MPGMPTYCFCGCGRRVRFAKKRLSTMGGEIRATVAALRTVSKPLAHRSDDDEAKQKINTLIEHGDESEAMFAGIIHGTLHAPAPPVQRQFHDWRRAAIGIASLHLQLGQDERAVEEAALPTEWVECDRLIGQAHRARDPRGDDRERAQPEVLVAWGLTLEGQKV